MATNPDLLNRALEVGGEKAKKATANRALRAFIARREQEYLLELFGKFDWQEDYDYKQERIRPVPLYMDTSVWSLALRRDALPDAPRVQAAEGCLDRRGSRAYIPQKEDRPACLCRFV
jgi:hypothetical protein